MGPATVEVWGQLRQDRGSGQLKWSNENHFWRMEEVESARIFKLESCKSSSEWGLKSYNPARPLPSLNSPPRNPSCTCVLRSSGDLGSGGID